MLDVWELIAHISPKEIRSVMKLSREFEAAYVIQRAYRRWRFTVSCKCTYSGCGETPW